MEEQKKVEALKKLGMEEVEVVDQHMESGQQKSESCWRRGFEKDFLVDTPWTGLKEPGRLMG